jgi:phosphate/sulfate permease
MKRPFLSGFLIGLLIFVLLNLVAAHLRSDCGLAAVFGFSHCADDISRAGFPVVFYEQGGFAYHSMLDPVRFIVDAVIGLVFAVGCGFFWRWQKKRNGTRT